MLFWTPTGIILYYLLAAGPLVAVVVVVLPLRLAARSSVRRRPAPCGGAIRVFLNVHLGVFVPLLSLLALGGFTVGGAFVYTVFALSAVMLILHLASGRNLGLPGAVAGGVMAAGAVFVFFLMALGCFGACMAVSCGLWPLVPMLPLVPFACLVVYSQEASAAFESADETESRNWLTNLLFIFGFLGALAASVTMRLLFPSDPFNDLLALLLV